MAWPGLLGQARPAKFAWPTIIGRARPIILAGLVRPGPAKGEDIFWA